MDTNEFYMSRELEKNKDFLASLKIETKDIFDVAEVRKSAFFNINQKMVTQIDFSDVFLSFLISRNPEAKSFRLFNDYQSLEDFFSNLKVEIIAFKDKILIKNELEAELVVNAVEKTKKLKI